MDIVHEERMENACVVVHGADGKGADGFTVVGGIQAHEFLSFRMAGLVVVLVCHLHRRFDSRGTIVVIGEFCESPRQGRRNFAGEPAGRASAHEILKRCAYPGAEYAFSCMYLWSDYFGELGRAGERLTQHAPWRGREVYLYPAGTGDLREAIEAIRADAAERGNPMRLRSLTNETRAELEALYPGKFEFTACRNSYDYIYTVEELSELHGKKLQSKRNHCNRFEDEFPDWFTAPITDENLPQCHEMLRIWYEQHEPAVNAQELDQLQLEKAALQRAFDHFDELEMDGLLLSDGERIIAFSMGSRMNRDYYDVGFEKAFPDVNGAYAMINREFSRMIAEKYPEVRFLNREDDMGSEGLRRAKESYQPTVLLEKYTADWKES